MYRSKFRRAHNKLEQYEIQDLEDLTETYRKICREQLQKKRVKCVHGNL